MGFFTVQGVTGASLLRCAWLKLSVHSPLMDNSAVGEHCCNTSCCGAHNAGLLSARTSSAASGEAEGGTGVRLEKLVKSGVAGIHVYGVLQNLQQLKAAAALCVWVSYPAG
jgi:hypothetical protein